MKIDSTTEKLLQDMVDKGVFSSKSAALTYIIDKMYFTYIKIQKIHENPEFKNLPIR